MSESFDGKVQRALQLQPIALEIVDALCLDDFPGEVVPAQAVKGEREIRDISQRLAHNNPELTLNQAHRLARAKWVQDKLCICVDGLNSSCSIHGGIL